MFVLIEDIEFADPNDARAFTAVLVELYGNYDLSDDDSREAAMGEAEFKAENTVGELADHSSPTLFATREETEAYLKKNVVSYTEL
jgi:hypothetical protein